MSGLLIVFEGIDGAGKSTVAERLAVALRARGQVVRRTFEPTDGPIGQKIRALAKGQRASITAEQELALFLEDRAEHVRTLVRPALARGEVVIQDRSYFSTVAYQGERGLDRAMILERNEAIAPRPDLLVVLDLPAEVALTRIRRRREGPDDFERRDALARMREVFAGFEGALVVDATLPPDRVFGVILDAAMAQLRPPGGAAGAASPSPDAG